VVDKYSVLEFSHILATKLDETVHLGSILSLVYKTKKPLSFVTTGQEVPQDIEIANIEKLITNSI
jgi:flagellar biosynthesis protein FlhF